jgi:hypothetical protein
VPVKFEEEVKRDPQSFAKTVGQTDESADNDCRQINDKNENLKKKLMVLETLHSNFVASAKSVISRGRSSLGEDPNNNPNSCLSWITGDFHHCGKQWTCVKEIETKEPNKKN